MMTTSYCEIIRHHCRELQPLPTEAVPVLRRLPRIKAVLFDVYGTLFMSASGDVGVASEERHIRSFQQALAAAGLRLQRELPDNVLRSAVDCFLAAIGADHAKSKALGIAYPEVDIVEIWSHPLQFLVEQGALGPESVLAADTRRLAVEYEVRTNPTWPMPGLAGCLRGLRERGIAMGIVSNAQFFTPELFPALLGESTLAAGFEADLEFYSYQHGQAKPGTALYLLAREALSDREIEEHDVLYIGNDMLNDVLAASDVGFQTALFAGDARSLRWRADDPRVAGIKPDVVLTDLGQLAACIDATDSEVEV